MTDRYKPISALLINSEGKEHRLHVTLEGVDVSGEVYRGEGRANPFGWSVVQLHHRQIFGETEEYTHIGQLYCGFPDDIAPGYSVDLVEVQP